MDATRQDSEQDTGAAEGTARVAQETLLPVPVQRGTGTGERKSLWRRIAIRRGERRSRARATSLDNEALLARLDALDERLSGVESTIDRHFEQLEHRFLQLWEIEEHLGRLGELPDKVEGLMHSSESVERSVRGLRRRLFWQSSLFVLMLCALAASAALLTR